MYWRKEKRNVIIEFKEAEDRCYYCLHGMRKSLNDYERKEINGKTDI